MRTTAFFLSLLLTGISASAQYANDRVYTANQVSNTVSVIDPSTDKLLGEIKLGNPYPNVLSPLYKGQALVHGMGYSAKRKMLAVVAIGSNSVTLISTEDNKVLKTIYLGRAPHEATFTPDGNQIWISVRGEAYISVIDAATMTEIKKVSIADGPGMVSFSLDGKIAYVCSSFTPELDIVDTKTYQIIKKTPVVSPFSPNIFTSPDGALVAMTHKDVGKITVIDTKTQSIAKVLSTGAITNHVSFCVLDKKLLMLVSVGGENKVRVFDVADNFRQMDTVNIGALPHGLWPSPDGKQLYVGLEFGDQVQHIDLQTMKIKATIQIGQSPQALVYAANAVSASTTAMSLTPLNDTTSTQVIELIEAQSRLKGHGRLAIRQIGLTDLVEQIFTGLEPNTAYTLSLTKSTQAPYALDYEINNFTTDANGKYLGQSTGIVYWLNNKSDGDYHHILLSKNGTKQTILLNK
ncbi:YncE family protein [Taibaiella soli]|uniref:YncE family protein n=1 Tax=Taibaiella soli TaxID=1649169 RepID=A0A2W2B9W8_9BACT|nr:beta-propeller fold lactonase family protein [Taibaiella soli]PZF72697.1 YncE family protein [Taibaiella soli]